MSGLEESAWINKVPSSPFEEAIVSEEELGIGVVPRRWAIGEDALRCCRLMMAAWEGDCDLEELGVSV
jgi:hypothetical protein